MTWFIRYIYYWKLQLTYNVIIFKANVFPPWQAYVTVPDLAILFRPVGFITHKDVLFLLSILFTLSVPAVKIIPKTPCRVLN